MIINQGTGAYGRQFFFCIPEQIYFKNLTIINIKWTSKYQIKNYIYIKTFFLCAEKSTLEKQVEKFFQKKFDKCMT